jgi:hypothetical protein
VGRTVLPELDGTHLAPEVALSHRLDLYESGERRHGRHQRKSTRYRTAPRSRQNTASGGITADVTIISAT